MEGFKFIVTRNYEVMRNTEVDPHRDQFNAVQDEVVKVTVLPPNGDFFEKDLFKWEFCYAQEVLPGWFDKAHRDAVFMALVVWLGECRYDGVTLESLEDKSFLFLKDVRVDHINNSTIQVMRGTSWIGSLNATVLELMRDTSTIDEVRGRSAVQEMQDGAIIGAVYDFSHISYMRDVSRIEGLCEHARIDSMYQYSSVGTMKDWSYVGIMLEDTSVDQMECDSTVDSLWKDASIGKMKDRSVVNETHDSSRIVVMQDGSDVRRMHDCSSAIFMTGRSTVQAYSMAVQFNVQEMAVVIVRDDHKLRVVTAK